MVSQDKAYQNTMSTFDNQNACMENDRVLQSSIFGVMSDNMELFKQFKDNPSFKKWLVDMVFNVTCNVEGKPYEKEIMVLSIKRRATMNTKKFTK